MSVAKNDPLLDYNYLLERAYNLLKNKISSKEETRWRLPIPQIEYRKNRTIIVNFKQICDYMKRDPKLVAKFFSKELFVQTVIEGHTLVINKRVSFETIRKKLKEFVDIFVKCPVCGKPDTELIEKAKKVYYIKCHACGAESPVAYKF